MSRRLNALALVLPAPLAKGDAAYFGNPDCRAQMLDPRLAEEVSSVVLGLRPEK